jgi:predicted nucleotidyltransferase
VSIGIVRPAGWAAEDCLWPPADRRRLGAHHRTDQISVPVRYDSPTGQRTVNELLQDRVSMPPTGLDEFCRRNHVRKRAFFGSVLRNDFRPESGVDVLVWFDPDERLGYPQIMEMEAELSGMLGRKVDLRTPEELSRYSRDDGVEKAEVLFAAQGRGTPAAHA